MTIENKHFKQALLKAAKAARPLSEQMPVRKPTNSRAPVLQTTQEPRTHLSEHPSSHQKKPPPKQAFTIDLSWAKAFARGMMPKHTPRLVKRAVESRKSYIEFPVGTPEDVVNNIMGQIRNLMRNGKREVPTSRLTGDITWVELLSAADALTERLRHKEPSPSEKEARA